MSGIESQALSDEELVRRIQSEPGFGAGAGEAAEALFGRYRRRTYLWCFRFVRNHDRALDLAQDVLLKAWQALPRYDARAPFACWMFTIARNRCFSAMRPVSLARDEEVDLEALADEGPGPEVAIENDETGAAMIELIATVLDRSEQDALYLRCWERLPVEEVTRLLGIEGPSVARGVLQRGRRKLRAALLRRSETRNAP